MTGTRTHYSRWRAAALVLPILVLGSCTEDPLRTLGPSEPGPERPAQGSLGLIEVTITGIGEDGTPRTSALSVPDALALERAWRRAGRLSGGDGDGDGVGDRGGRGGGLESGAVLLQALPGNADASGNGTIQLEPHSSGSFTLGTRGEGGYRYVSVTYRVRNAQADSTPYDTPRKNLTFYAVDTKGTLGETPISRLNRFDGSEAATDPAAILPTGAARLDPATGKVEPNGADMLQIETEARAASLRTLAGAGTESVFPYGFVVRNPSTPESRTLLASPDDDDFAGLVTFAFKIPLAASAAEDPFTVSAIFMAVDEDEARITQSLEEQTPEGQAAFEARAATLGATMLTVLPGSGYAGASSRLLCSVRTAGTKDSPTGYLVDDCAEGARSWTGEVDTNWNSPGNWLPAGVPTPIDTVLVPTAVNAPVLASPARIAGLTVADGTSLDLGAFDLTVTGDVLAEAAAGEVTGTTGRLILEGATPGSASGRLPGVTVTGSYTATGDLEVKGTLVIESGRLHTTGHRITISN
jgi:hypothetical protein